MLIVPLKRKLVDIKSNLLVCTKISRLIFRTNTFINIKNAMIQIRLLPSSQNYQLIPQEPATILS